MASAYDFDLVVIGAGSAGMRASRIAAGFGAKVAVVEKGGLGGTCVNVGCVPKKLFVHAAEFSGLFADAADFGWKVAKPTHDFARFMTAQRAQIERLHGVYRELLQEAGVELIEGSAQFADAHTLDVGARRVTAKHFVIATGGRPIMPKVDGRELLKSSDDMFTLDELPKRVIVLGGGYIGVEFAAIFQGLGCEVSIVQKGESLLLGFDDDITKFVQEQLEQRGVKVILDCGITKAEQLQTGLRVTLNSGAKLEADIVLSATGRKPNSDALSLDKAGVKVDDNGSICVDEYSRTNLQHIYAIGDVTDRVSLTPVAIAEGIAVARTLFGNEPTKPDHCDVPSAVFGFPNVGAVGLTEQGAREQGKRLKIFVANFRSLKQTMTTRNERTLMKVVVDADSDRVLGVHIAGEHAGEMVQGFAVAVKMGATKAQLDRTIGIHPTMAEELVTMREPVRDDTKG
jgi:glutathione reductase (NADPH)